MGCGKSKVLTGKGLIKFIENRNSAKLIIEEHTDLLNEKEQGTFGASLAAGYIDGYQNESEGLFYDHSRVILYKENGSHTYLNASYINGFDCPDGYITTKTPQSRMATYNFLEDGVGAPMRSYRYARRAEDQPKYSCDFLLVSRRGFSLQCGKLKVTTSTIHLDHHNFELMKLIITHQDGGSLTSDFIDFMRMISLYRHSTVTPTTLKGYTSLMVVHCSDGLERSMAFCAIDISIAEIKKPAKGRFVLRTHSVIISDETRSFIPTNASYIDGFKDPHAYIATRTPDSKSTTEKFWRMIWRHKTKIIVMLDRPEENWYGASFWNPDTESSLQFGKLNIKKFKSHQFLSSFDILKVEMTHEDGGTLQVNYFLFKGWQRHDKVPLESELIDFIFMIRLYNQSAVTPESLKASKVR
ncbi:hypothetical protein G9C98_000661 [Cotesia typhae]|uniref:protein-tyrosine-phosphatase n=1 Tax=Cotesia typhae TaxID=2053667 RepID=A0A8J5VC97_9HYME|nr:hypothetical protein G9C98_000661 [Cotesia typhae]